MDSNKNKTRFIPKPIFQFIAILLLLGCIALTIESVSQQKWPFIWLIDKFGEGQWWLSAFLTFLIWFVGWVAIIIPIRRFSQMPTYQEELASASSKNFTELLEHQREKMHLDKEGELPPEQEVIRSKWLAIGGLIAGVTAGAATAVIFLISDIIWVSGVAIALVGIVMGSWHGLKALFTN